MILTALGVIAMHQLSGDHGGMSVAAPEQAVAAGPNGMTPHSYRGDPSASSPGIGTDRAPAGLVGRPDQQVTQMTCLAVLLLLVVAVWHRSSLQPRVFRAFAALRTVGVLTGRRSRGPTLRELCISRT